MVGTSRWIRKDGRPHANLHAQAQAYNSNPQPAPRTGQNVSRSRHRPHHSRTRNSTPLSRASPFRSPPHQPNHRPSPARRQKAFTSTWNVLVQIQLADRGGP